MKDLAFTAADFNKGIDDLFRTNDYYKEYQIEKLKKQLIEKLKDKGEVIFYGYADIKKLLGLRYTILDKCCNHGAKKVILDDQYPEGSFGRELYELDQKLDDELVDIVNERIVESIGGNNSIINNTLIPDRDFVGVPEIRIDRLLSKLKDAGFKIEKMEMTPDLPKEYRYLLKSNKIKTVGYAFTW